MVPESGEDFRMGGIDCGRCGGEEVRNAISTSCSIGYLNICQDIEFSSLISHSPPQFLFPLILSLSFSPLPALRIWLP